MNPGFKLSAPVQNRAPGRPRKTRIRSSSEGKGLGPRRKKCGRCEGRGHHANKCKNSVDAAFGEDEHWGAENAEEPAVQVEAVEVDDGTDAEDPPQEQPIEPTPTSTQATIIR